jgi:hypothetical protein
MPLLFTITPQWMLVQQLNLKVIFPSHSVEMGNEDRN